MNMNVIHSYDRKLALHTSKCLAKNVKKKLQLLMQKHGNEFPVEHHSRVPFSIYMISCCYEQ